MGSNLLVDSAVKIAKLIGISELVIGLTVVAIGTSLPEVATSVTAALKGESDIAIGNAVGSNIFNLLGLLGIGAFVSPNGIDVAQRVLRFDMSVMVFVALVALPIFYIDSRISRIEGALLLAYYLLYITHTTMRAANSSALPSIAIFITFFVPITFIALVVTAIRSSRAR